jgi:DNA-binding transcriptional LysR family regulator
MNFTLSQLQVFVKIVETQSITKAAEELHLTQPAVSIQLRNFQQQFDLPLTEILGRKIFITDFGKEIAQAALGILENVNEIKYKTQQYKGQLAGKLKISVVSTGKYVMPYFLSDFMKNHPGVELLMDVTNKDKVIKSLERNEVDFALVSILPDQLPIEHLNLIQNKLFLVGGSGLPFLPKSIEVKAIGTLPLIFRESGSGTRQTMEQFIKNKQVVAQKKMELTSNEAVKQALIAGLGYSIMPLIGIKNEISNGDLSMVQCKGLPIKTQWSLIWLKQKKLSPLAQAYLSFLKTNKKQIMEAHFKWYEEY